MKLIYKDTCGYDTELKFARSYLVKDQVYEYDYMVIHRFSTEVYLKEYPNKSFNSVHFESKKPGKWDMVFEKECKRQGYR